MRHERVEAPLLSPLAVELRRQDPDRYLSTLFAPPDVREALFALYAFDHEIAKVRRVVRQPMAGLIRLQWWQDAIDGTGHGEVPAHPVMRGLQRAMREQGLDRQTLERAIETRQRELDDVAPSDLPALERHLEVTCGTVVQAALTLLGALDPTVLEIGRRIGLVRGFLETLRWLDAQAADRPPWLPASMLAEQGIEAGLPKDACDPAGLTTIGAALAARAKEHLAAARRDRAAVARDQLPALFPGTLAGIRLRGPEHRPAIALAPARLAWCWLSGRF